MKSIMASAIIVLAFTACSAKKDASEETNLSVSSPADKASIEVGFNSADGFSTDITNIPNNKDTPQVQMINLSSEHIEEICYRGTAKNVLAKLDTLVKKAGSVGQRSVEMVTAMG